MILLKAYAEPRGSLAGESYPSSMQERSIRVAQYQRERLQLVVARQVTALQDLRGRYVKRLVSWLQHQVLGEQRAWDICLSGG
jgi:hypothetical protein